MAKLYAEIPAAFRRLCVETGVTGPMVTTVPAQPPLGGCVLKHRLSCRTAHVGIQPPLGGCVLKQESRLW